MSRKRKAGKRSVKPVMRIFTEGEKTEINYVRGYIHSYLRSRGYIAQNIVVEQPNDTSPYGLLEAAQRERLAGDLAWIVFDCDQHSGKAETFRDAFASNVKIAFSSISFETWILLHFIYSTHAYKSCDELMKKLDKYFTHGYNKALNNLFEETTGPNHARLQTAIANAKRLNREIQKVNTGRPIFELNPYTNVHELLESIDKFIKDNHF